MTATSQTFNALDTDLAGTGRLDASFTQREIVRNLNGLTRDHMHPCLSRMFELADTSSLASPHSRRFNAPEGAWTEVVEPCAINVPPGVTQLYVLVRMQVDNGATCYLYPVIDGQQLRGTTDATSSGILTCVGTGSAAHYGGSSATYGGPFTVDVSPSSNPVRRFSMVGQTTKFDVDWAGEVDSVDRGSFGYEDTATNVEQMVTGLSELTAVRLRREDYWVTLYKQREVAAAQYLDASGPTYTTVTGLSTHAAAEAIYPAAQAAGDIFYVGQDTPCDGHRFYLEPGSSLTSITIVVEYWNGSAWGSLTEWNFTPYAAPGHADFDGTKDKYHNTWWDRPSDWAASTVNSVGPYYWVRYRISAVVPIVSPSVRTFRTLHRRVTWLRLAGALSDETRFGVLPQMPVDVIDAGTGPDGTRDVFAAGRAAKAWLHAMHIRPVPIAGIV